MTGIKLIYSSCERAYGWIVLRYEGISVIVHWKRSRWIREFWVRTESHVAGIEVLFFMRLWQIGNVDEFFKKVRLKKIGAVRNWCFPWLHKNSQNQKTKLSKETRPAKLQRETCRDTYANFVASRHIERKRFHFRLTCVPQKRPLLKLPNFIQVLSSVKLHLANVCVISAGRPPRKHSHRIWIPMMFI